MSADFVCPHGAWEERNGGWCKCSDCGYGWSAPKATQPLASDAAGGDAPCLFAPCPFCGAAATLRKAIAHGGQGGEVGQPHPREWLIYRLSRMVESGPLGFDEHTLRDAIAALTTSAAPAVEPWAAFDGDLTDAHVSQVPDEEAARIDDALQPPVTQCSASTERVARAMYERIVYAGEDLQFVLRDYSEGAASDDIHSCSPFCTRPECVADRDGPANGLTREELRALERLEKDVSLMDGYKDVAKVCAALRRLVAGRGGDA